MKNLNSPELSKHRDIGLELSVYGHAGLPDCGAFMFRSPVWNTPLYVIASAGNGWEHVSASTENRSPSWEEMEFIKRQFFHDDECVMQLHPPLKDYITGTWPGRKSRFTLHLWRPTTTDIPTPPKWMVGANSKEEWEKRHQLADQELAAAGEEDDGQ